MKLLAVALLWALASLFPGGTAEARNAVEDVGADADCGVPDCFVPRFTFLGEVVRYSGTAVLSPLKVEAADCCEGPDRYQITVVGSRITVPAIPGPGTVTYTHNGSFRTSHNVGFAGCSKTWTTPSHVQIQTDPTAKVSMKLINVPGGLPASAYLRMSSGTWVQTQGTDSCGF